MGRAKESRLPSQMLRSCKDEGGHDVDADDDDDDDNNDNLGPRNGCSVNR